MPRLVTRSWAGSESNLSLWAKGRVGQRHYDWEVEAAGGKAAAERFYFYEPRIPVRDFVQGELFHDFYRAFHVATTSNSPASRAMGSATDSRAR